MNGAPNPWLSGKALERDFRVQETALLRYAKRGILGAQWDEPNGRWLFDATRVAQLFQPRTADGTNELPHLGILGAARLGGGGARKDAAIAERTACSPQERRLSYAS